METAARRARDAGLCDRDPTPLQSTRATAREVASVRTTVAMSVQPRYSHALRVGEECLLPSLFTANSPDQAAVIATGLGDRLVESSAIPWSRISITGNATMGAW